MSMQMSFSAGRLCLLSALACAGFVIAACVAKAPEPAKLQAPVIVQPAPVTVPQPEPEPVLVAGPAYDPLAWARDNDRLINRDRESVVPPFCYVRTNGVSNPCWVCHTESVSPNDQMDWDVQEFYQFTRPASANRWSNLLNNRTIKAENISDEDALAYIRQDNYVPLRQALEHFAEFPGFRPDLDFAQGFDDEGFARDGTGWRALRFKPFAGSFWPTNGSTDDVFIRLPAEFTQDAQGKPSREIAKANYAILEAAICADPSVPSHSNDSLSREVEPVSEAAAGYDLDADRKVGIASVIRGLPPTYAGGAAHIAVARYKYPQGTEFLHSVRYVDPDAPGMVSARMKELRYSRKTGYLDAAGVQAAYVAEVQKEIDGRLPNFAGTAPEGLTNPFGWKLQAFIEDAQGRLRLQSRQEHYFCMGCHSAIGVTVDQTFTFPRKVPGKGGWAYQDIAGMHDAPQAGHAEPEVLTYFKRVRGADEFRANTEMLDRFFPAGKLDEAAVRQAAKGGDKDLAWLLSPSRQRAIEMARAYMVTVRDQSFIRGRDATLTPPTNILRVIREPGPGLAELGNVHRDGRLWLDWDR